MGNFYKKINKKKSIFIKIRFLNGLLNELPNLRKLKFKNLTFLSNFNIILIKISLLLLPRVKVIFNYGPSISLRQNISLSFSTKTMIDLKYTLRIILK